MLDRSSRQVYVSPVGKIWVCIQLHVNMYYLSNKRGLNFVFPFLKSETHWLVNSDIIKCQGLDHSFYLNAPDRCSGRRCWKCECMLTPGVDLYNLQVLPLWGIWCVDTRWPTKSIVHEHMVWIVVTSLYIKVSRVIVVCACMYSFMWKEKSDDSVFQLKAMIYCYII